MQLDLLNWRKPAPESVAWTKDEVRRMVRLYVESEKPDIAAVAKALGRSYPMVAAQASRMGLSFDNLGPDAALRVCMPCRREFWSTHRFNRICPICKRGDLMECA